MGAFIFFVAYCWLKNRIINSFKTISILAIAIFLSQMAWIILDSHALAANIFVLIFSLDVFILFWAMWVLEKPHGLKPNRLKWYWHGAIIELVSGGASLFIGFSQPMTQENFLYGAFFDINFCFITLWVFLIYIYQVYYSQQQHSLLESSQSSEALVKLLHYESEQFTNHLERSSDAILTEDKAQVYSYIKQTLEDSNVPIFSDDMAVTLVFHRVRQKNSESWVDTTQWEMPVVELALFLQILTEILSTSRNENRLKVQLTALTDKRLVIGPLEEQGLVDFSHALVKGKHLEIYKYIKVEQRRPKVNVLVYLMKKYKLKAVIQVTDSQSQLRIEQVL